MRQYSTQLLFQPDSAELKFLPEGPYPCGEGLLSWVAIQHGPDATVGSLNLLDLRQRTNRSFPLPGRPGFAFPTDRPGAFVVGLEHQVGVFSTSDGEWNPLSDPVEQDVSGTIINDGVAFDGGLVFGCKDLKFAGKKAGLYLWRRSDRRMIRLRNDQICSNGKIIAGHGNQVTLLDIDTPTKQVVSYRLDVSAGTLSDSRVVVDLTADSDFPDGMIATPDGLSVIIAFYNPHDAEHGTARQYSLATGTLEAVWTVPGSPRVTCPQLVSLDGRIQLVLTTADEGMTPEQQRRHPQAGCLFIGDTDFTSLPDTPVFALP